MSRNKDWATEAAHAHTNLTTFHLVTKLMEGGGLYQGRCNPAAKKIIDICESESQKELARYDHAISKIKE